MKILIASAKGKLQYSMEFAQALERLGVEARCVCDRDYYALSEFKILKYLPFPKLLKLIKQFNPDITFTDVPFYTAHMAKLQTRPLVVFLRGDMWTEMVWNRGRCPSLPHRVLLEWKHLVQSYGIKKADLVLAICGWLEKRIKNHLAGYPTGVLHKGMKPQVWDPQYDGKLFDLEHPAIVGVFDLEIYPKVAGLLKFVECAKKMPTVSFYFAGSGPYMNLARQNISSNIVLLGRIEKSEVRRFLASGDIFVHPSGWDALPTTVMEACLMEKPVIASNVGGIPEIVMDNETGYLCDVTDTSQWIRRIQFLLDNPKAAESLGKKARQHVMRKFDWNRIAIDFMRMLTEKKTNVH